MMRNAEKIMENAAKYEDGIQKLFRGNVEKFEDAC